MINNTNYTVKQELSAKTHGLNHVVVDYQLATYLNRKLQNVFATEQTGAYKHFNKLKLVHDLCVCSAQQLFKTVNG